MTGPMSATQSATRVRKGRTVRISGSLRYATNAGYVADNGEKVLAQVKVGTRWVTKATLTANSTGAVTYSCAPTRTTLRRFSSSIKDIEAPLLPGTERQTNNLPGR